MVAAATVVLTHDLKCFSFKPLCLAAVPTYQLSLLQQSTVNMARPIRVEITCTIDEVLQYGQTPSDLANKVFSQWDGRGRTVNSMAIQDGYRTTQVPQQDLDQWKARRQTEFKPLENIFPAGDPSRQFYDLRSRGDVPVMAEPTQDMATRDDLSTLGLRSTTNTIDEPLHNSDNSDPSGRKYIRQRGRSRQRLGLSPSQEDVLKAQTGSESKVIKHRFEDKTFKRALHRTFP